MTIFKTFQEILDTPWEEQDADPTIPRIVPDTVQWHGIRDMTIDDVEIWEQIHYQGGNVGIYAAWKPFGELYMIVYNLYASKESGIEIYYGPEAAAQVYEKSKILGINLAINKVWIDELNKWQYDDFRLAPS